VLFPVINLFFLSSGRENSPVTLESLWFDSVEVSLRSARAVVFSRRTLAARP
jgi:hypothetical protein